MGVANVGVANQRLAQLETHAMRKPTPDTSWRALAQRLDRPEAYDITKHNWKQRSVIRFLRIFCNPHRLASSNCHQKGFTWQLSETDAETRSQTLGNPQKRGETDRRSQRGQGPYKKTSQNQLP